MTRTRRLRMASRRGARDNGSQVPFLLIDASSSVLVLQASDVSLPVVGEEHGLRSFDLLAGIGADEVTG